MAEILLAISAWQLAMRLKQPMSRAGCYTFCQPSSVSNHWLFVPVPPLTWNCQVAILGMKGTHDENDGTGMVIWLWCNRMFWNRCYWWHGMRTNPRIYLEMTPPSSFFGGVRAAQFRSDALSLGYRDVHPALDPENYNYCVPKISARPFHVGTQFPTRSCTKQRKGHLLEGHL